MMKKIILLTLCLTLVGQGFSQIQYSNSNSLPGNFIQNLSGPRIGFTILTDGQLTENLDDEFGLKSNFITQFGYQFEKQIMGDDKIAGLVEGLLFIGGLEHGLFLPSLSGMFGARFQSGYEFAIGPNISLSGAALVLGVGKTIKAGNLNIPINFAWVPSTTRQETSYDYPALYDDEGNFIEYDYSKEIETVETNQTGHRFTITVGFNFRSR